jgi:ubiquinone/menaquinone biosynthesis C-methylase UbiE
MSFDYTGFYNAIAPYYAQGQDLLPMWRRYTEAVLPWVMLDSVILEIGPGPGVLLEQLALRGEAAIGLDLSPGMLAQAQARLRAMGMPANLLNGDAARIPLADASVDVIVTTFAFSAIPDGVGALAEMARVVRPGGLVALVDSCVPSSGNPVGTALARLWEQFGDFMRDEAALMGQAGLEVVARREFGAFDSIRLVVGRRPDASG